MNHNRVMKKKVKKEKILTMAQEKELKKQEKARKKQERQEDINRRLADSMKSPEGSEKKRLPIIPIILCVVGILLIVFGIMAMSKGKNKQDAHWYDNSKTIVHALGDVDEYSVLNCREGFEEAYAKGHRVFEADFSVTSDGYLVMSHEWEEGRQEGIDPDHIPTKAEFCETPIYGRFTPLTYEDLVAILREYPDTYLVTDFKSEDSQLTYDQIRLLVDETKQYGAEDLLKRFVVQFYAQEEFPVIRKMADFGDYIFTLYKTDFNGEPDQFREVAKFCRKNKIHTIVMRHLLYRKELGEIADKMGLEIYVHTVDKKYVAKSRAKYGAHGIYTSKITEEEYASYKQNAQQWFDVTDKISELGDVSAKSLDGLYQDGGCAIKGSFSGNEAVVADFLKSHADAYFVTDYYSGIREDLEACDGVSDQIVLCLHSRDEIKDVIEWPVWYSTIYMAEGEFEGMDPAGDFASILNYCNKKGISAASFDDAYYESSFDQIRTDYDEVVYLPQGGLR